MCQLQVGKLRFELPFLKQDLHAWIMTDAKLFDEPIPFQPTRGCQRFMQVNRKFWEDKFNVTPTRSTPTPSACDPEPKTSQTTDPDSLEPPTDLPQSLLIITLSSEETERILSGEQEYLLRSQRVQTGQINIAVKTMGFAIPGTVEFESIQEFQSLKAFKMWDGLNKCNPDDVQAGSSWMKRLREGKTVYVIKLVRPQKSTQCVEWCASESRSHFIYFSLSIETSHSNPHSTLGDARDRKKNAQLLKNNYIYIYINVYIYIYKYIPTSLRGFVWDHNSQFTFRIHRAHGDTEDRKVL